MIVYSESLEGIDAGKLAGFFVDWGWHNPPSPEIHLRLLQNSDYVVLAIDSDTGHVAGYITAISDNVLSAYIPPRRYHGSLTLFAPNSHDGKGQWSRTGLNGPASFRRSPRPA